MFLEGVGVFRDWWLLKITIRCVNLCIIFSGIYGCPYYNYLYLTFFHLFDKGLKNRISLNRFKMYFINCQIKGPGLDSILSRSESFIFSDTWYLSSDPYSLSLSLPRNRQNFQLSSLVSTCFRLRHF